MVKDRDEKEKGNENDAMGSTARHCYRKSEQST